MSATCWDKHIASMHEKCKTSPFPKHCLHRKELQHVSHVVNYRVLSHVLRLHSHRVLKVLPEKR